MARGFESKDVEFQQAEAERAAPSRRAMSPAERDKQTRRKTLELALANVRATRRTARSAAHRQMLDEAAAALERDLDALR
jgi:hypothetical protein